MSTRFGRMFVLFAICSLTFSLATRFVAVPSEAHSIKAIISHAPEAKRQHMLGDGAHWTAPALTFTLLEPPTYSHHIICNDVLPTNLVSESWLYNRPPPVFTPSALS